jgi:signal transduction histidine kinase
MSQFHPIGSPYRSIRTYNDNSVGTSGFSIVSSAGFLRMAVINLVDNAVKYSPCGSTVRLILSDGKNASSQTEFVQLAIEDEGPGVPEDKTSRVLDRFYRVDEGRTRTREAPGSVWQLQTGPLKRTTVQSA